MSNRASKTAAPTDAAEQDAGDAPSHVMTPGPADDAESGEGDAPSRTPPTAGGEPGSHDPLDHDRDGRKGGSAPAPAVTHLVVLESDAKRGLTAGEVIAVADADVKPLLADDTCRSATAAEVELAQPRIRVWMGLA